MATITPTGDMKRLPLVNLFKVGDLVQGIGPLASAGSGVVAEINANGLPTQVRVKFVNGRYMLAPIQQLRRG